MKARSETLTLTPSEVRHAQKERNTLIRSIILIVIISTLGSIIFGNQLLIIMMQEDILNTLNDMRIELQEVYSENQSQINSESQDNPSVISLTPAERELICRVVAAEARGEDLQGQMAVAQTILDRAELWNMTPAEVVQAPGQYAYPYQGEIPDSVKLAVANVFDGGIRIFQDPVTHFHSGPEPYWAADKVNRGSIGRHQFYY